MTALNGAELAFESTRSGVFLTSAIPSIAFEPNGLPIAATCSTVLVGYVSNCASGIQVFSRNWWRLRRPRVTSSCSSGGSA